MTYRTEETHHVICDAPGCKARGPNVASRPEAMTRAVADGWTISATAASWRHFCPEHRAEAHIGG